MGAFLLEWFATNDHKATNGHIHHRHTPQENLQGMELTQNRFSPLDDLSICGLNFNKKRRNKGADDQMGTGNDAGTVETSLKTRVQFTLLPSHQAHK